MQADWYETIIIVSISIVVIVVVTAVLWMMFMMLLFLGSTCRITIKVFFVLVEDELSFDIDDTAVAFTLLLLILLLPMSSAALLTTPILLLLGIVQSFSVNGRRHTELVVDKYKCLVVL